MNTTNYYIDNYSSGCARDIRGPFQNLNEARARVDGVEVSVEPYDGVVEQLSAAGGDVELVEAWSKSEDSEDYQAIYSVTK